MFIFRAGSAEEMAPPVEVAAPAAPQATVIPGADSLIGDLLDMDLGPPSYQQQQFAAAPPPAAQPAGGMDLLGEGLDSLLGPTAPVGGDLFGGGNTISGLGEIFGLSQATSYVPPAEVCYLILHRDPGVLFKLYC